MEVKEFLFAAFEDVGDEKAGLELFKEAGEGGDGDGVGAEGARFDAEFFQQRLDLLEEGELARGGFDDFGDKEVLGFEGAALHAGEKLLVHDALVEGVLVDDDQAVGGFGDEVAVVELHGGEFGAGGCAVDGRGR